MNKAVLTVSYSATSSMYYCKALLLLSYSLLGSLCWTSHTDVHFSTLPLSE